LSASVLILGPSALKTEATFCGVNRVLYVFLLRNVGERHLASGAAPFCPPVTHQHVEDGDALFVKISVELTIERTKKVIFKRLTRHDLSTLADGHPNHLWSEKSISSSL